MENELLKRRRIAKAFAKAIIRRDELAEEIASDVVVKILEGKKIETSTEIKSATVDAIRTRFGRPGTKRHEHGRLEIVRLDATLEGHAWAGEKPWDDLEIAKRQFDQIKRRLTPLQLDFCRFVMEGGTFVEFAKRNKVTISAVSQMLRQIQKKVRKIKDRGRKLKAKRKRKRKLCRKKKSK